MHRFCLYLKFAFTTLSSFTNVQLLARLSSYSGENIPDIGSYDKLQRSELDLEKEGIFFFKFMYNVKRLYKKKKKRKLYWTGILMVFQFWYRKRKRGIVPSLIGSHYNKRAVSHARYLIV